MQLDVFREPERAHPSSHSAMTRLHAWSLDHCDAHVKSEELFIKERAVNAA